MSCFWRSSLRSLVSSVSTNPGATALQVIPRDESSRARVNAVADAVFAPAGGDDDCSFRLQELRGRKPDAAGRAGDDTDLAGQSEIHGPLR